MSASETTWAELEANVLMHTVKRMPVTLVKGKGVFVWDDRGRKYLDFVGGWAVNSLGHCHPVIVNAINKQAKRLIQTSNQFYTIPQLKLAQLLVENSCMDKVFFCNSGAEANEGAIKLARRYGKIYLNGAYEVITTYGSFHGRTLAMVAATGQNKYQEPYIPLPDGFINVEYNNINAIKDVTNKNTCAVMIEPVQGEGGINVPDDNYLREVREWCNQRGIIMILDEIQTGIGRLGSKFGYEIFGVEPDIITLAKGLGGGVPIGAILSKNKVAVFLPGEHGTTYGGNPLVCATSFAVLKYILENNLVSKVRELSKYFIDKLNELKNDFSIIAKIRGMGFLLGIEFQTDIAGELVLKCLDKGLLINAVKPNIVRFMPPLIINRKHIEDAINILKEVLDTEQEICRKK